MVTSKQIPLLAEGGRRGSRREARARQGEASRKTGAPGWSVRQKVSADLTTPSAAAPHPPLLCKEGK